jgi:hypothetical protein
VAEAPPIRTRKPTGKPPWPLILLSGAEKCGKSYNAAEFSASDLIDQTWWIEVGEGAADQYGALPGARYEIVEHDGSYRGILAAVQWAVSQPRPNGKPHAIVLDSGSELWDLLSDEAQLVANERERRKAIKEKRQPATGDRDITADIWNTAKKRWRRIITLLRKYDGPAIITARLELVTVMAAGKPTTEKTWKVKAEKNLPSDVDAVIRIPAPRVVELTGVRSVILRVEPGKSIPLPDFTIDGLLRRLGLDQADATSPRTYVEPRPDPADLEAETESEAQQQRGGQARGPRAITPPKGWTPQMAEQLAADFLAAIEGAPDERAREEAAAEIKKAVRLGKITPSDRDKLIKAYEGADQREQQKGEATA